MSDFQTHRTNRVQQKQLGKESFLPKLIEYFEEKPELIAVYIFGSQVSGKIRKDSDFDIALLCKMNIVKNPLIYRINVITDLMNILKKKVDVIILNSANLLLRAQVFQKGELVYEKDKAERVAFQANSMSLYYDYKRYFEYHSQNLIKKIKTYGLG